MEKALIQLFIPLADNEGRPFPGDWYREIGRDLNERFGGVSIYQQAPVTGLWKEKEQHTQKDELIIYEVMTDQMELSFWKPFKEQLQLQFRQERILIRSMSIQIM